MLLRYNFFKCQVKTKRKFCDREKTYLTTKKEPNQTTRYLDFLSSAAIKTIGPVCLFVQYVFELEIVLVIKVVEGDTTLRTKSNIALLIDMLLLRCCTRFLFTLV